MLVSMLMAATLVTGEITADEVIHDFSRDDARRFRCVNDTVMGGRSSSRVEATESGTLRFSGTVSLENNGGFTSFSARDGNYDIRGGDGVVVRVKGDGRNYILSFDLAGVPIPAGGYWQSFATEKDRWIDVRLPFSGFVPTSFGRELEGLPAVTPDRIRGVTVYLYDKKAGPFSAEFDSISTYRDAAPAGAAPGADANDAASLLPANCSTLATLLSKTGLDAAIRDLGAFTLFAPTDEAFRKLPADTVAALLAPENAAALKRVLLHHVVASPVTAWKAAQLTSARMLDGGEVGIARDGDGLRIGGARVIEADRLRLGGVVHVIDAVLVPADIRLAPPTSPATTVVLAAIERGVPLFNDGNVAACAAVYRTAVEAIVALAPESLDAGDLAALRAALAESAPQPDREAAWTLRRAMDAVASR